MTANTICSNDVLCGRGGATNNHIGNKRFRAVVAEYQNEYLLARKKDKVLIARRVVDRIKQNNGRFLKRASGSDVWAEVTYKKATEKTSQALREGLDVRHKTIRPEKMPRIDDENSEQSPRKRARLVVGKVIDSPMATPAFKRRHAPPTIIPDLNDESFEADPMFQFFQPPMISQKDCEDVAAV